MISLLFPYVEVLRCLCVVKNVAVDVRYLMMCVLLSGTTAHQTQLWLMHWLHTTSRTVDSRRTLHVRCRTTWRSRSSMTTYPMTFRTSVIT